MSLKAFHFFFIVVAILLSVGFAGWCMTNYYSPGGHRADLAFGIGSAVLAVTLVIYERYFVKKLKKVSYL